MNARRKTVYVAMSGGVDSSAAAALLTERGFRVVGVFMKPWQPAGVACQWHQDRTDALRVATALGIPLLTWDFSSAYGAKVARPMVAGYRAGITPNPDVECNRHIKFGLFLRRALAGGADAIATGHYARIRRIRSAGGSRKAVLARAKDRNKDQTYFLWGVPQAALERVLFPVGGMLKSEVRGYAKKRNLPVAGKKDSQGVCFVGEMDFKSFLARRIRSRRGLIRDREGTVLGGHDGVSYYTVGQRHGLGLPGGTGPWYVTGKDIRRNELIVGPAEDLACSRARITGTRWFAGKPGPRERVSVAVRYRSPARPAVISSRGIIRFLRPVRAVAAGQSAVVYRNGCVIGGGILV
ncbi:MAG TPA: tRNA 2-thiouridine(34) synthase MnmA [Candidatus Paceibacterota bacterium]|nr:tRNA 2-thiouridine(34) synthase MnmA [Candidatus Paceibacterota bacterium]